MTNIKSLTSIIPLAIILLGLVSYNFMSAAWTQAPANPPNNNASAPINVGTSTQSFQVGKGQFTFDRVNALTQMRSQEYCDLSGNVCFSAANVKSQLGFSCPDGQAVTGFSTTGVVSCAAFTVAYTPPPAYVPNPPFVWVEDADWHFTGYYPCPQKSYGSGDMYSKNVSCIDANGKNVDGTNCPAPMRYPQTSHSCTEGSD